METRMQETWTRGDIFGLADKIDKGLGKGGFPDGSDGKEFTCNAADPGSMPGSGRRPEEGNGNLLQYVRLKNSMDRGARRATVHGVIKSQT